MRLGAFQRPVPPQRAPDSSGDDTGVHQGSASSSGKSFFDNSDDEEKEFVLLHAECREEWEQKALRLNESRLVIDQKRVEKDLVNSNRN